jgi:hypothetical protein
VPPSSTSEGIEELEHGDRATGRVALREVVPLEELRDGRRAREREELLRAHVEPFPVAPDLEPVRVVVEDGERLLLVCARVRVDVGARERWPRARTAARVADARGVVPDDEDDPVTEVLELPQLLQDDRVAEVDVGGGRVEAELDAQRSPCPSGLLEARGKGSHRQGVRGVPRQEVGIGGGGFHRDGC